MTQKLPDGTWIVGNKLYAICDDCGNIICMNKFLFGALHSCPNKKTDSETWKVRK